MDNTKQWLSRYRNNQARVARLQERLDALDMRIESIQSQGCMSGGDNLDNLSADRSELQHRIDRLSDRGRVIRTEICEAIDALENPRYWEVLTALYIDGNSIQSIADNMGYSERRIYTLYSEGVAAISKIG